MAVFILQQENGGILSRGFEWSLDTTPQTVFSSPHRDVALNQLLELVIKDSALRARAVPCDLDARGLPVLPAVPRPQLALIDEGEADIVSTDTSVAS